MRFIISRLSILKNITLELHIAVLKSGSLLKPIVQNCSPASYISVSPRLFYISLHHCNHQL